MQGLSVSFTTDLASPLRLASTMGPKVQLAATVGMLTASVNDVPVDVAHHSEPLPEDENMTCMTLALLVWSASRSFKKQLAHVLCAAQCH